MKETSSLSTSKGFTLTKVLVSIGMLAIISFLILFRPSGPTPHGTYAPPTLGKQGIIKRNLQELSEMFFQFKMDNGEYPSDKTAKILREKHSHFNFGALQGNNSNAYFRQFFYSANNNYETPFYAKISVDSKESREVDQELADGEALKRGENGMSYVMLKGKDNARIKLSIKADNIPLAMTSVYPSNSPYTGDQLIVDNSSFEGNFFILFADGSIKNAEKNLIEDENDESKARFDPSKPSIFPKNKQGASSAGQYLILTPEL